MNNKTLRIGIIILALIGVGLFLRLSDNSSDNSVEAETENAEVVEEVVSSETEKKEEEVVEEDKSELLNEGELALDFELEDIDGNMVSLKELRGSKVYLKFWASWCPVCVSGLDKLDELFATEKDFLAYTIVMPGLNGEMDKEEFMEWFNELGHDNIKILFDTSGEVARQYKLRAVPTSAFIGSDGVHVNTVLGEQDSNSIINEFSKIK